MHPRRRASALVVAGLLLPSMASAFTPETLWSAWDVGRLVRTPAPCFSHDDLVAQLRALADAHPGDVALDPIGTSAQGRSIQMLRVGHGQRRVLLWSQMHGDEPSATPALLDLVDYLLAQRTEDADAARILDQLELLVVPMLNPDGAAAYRRENAQAIDINRDALALTTPEGRILKRVRDDFEPVLGFNLHDQNRRRTAGDSGVLATNAVLAVSGDADNTLTPGRLRAERAAVAVQAALAPFFPGGLARYDDEFNPRAFGDNITSWGTPVLLIESGGVPDPHPLTDLTRANFVAILAVLRDLAANDLGDWDAARYEEIPENELGDWVDVLVHGGRIRQPGTAEPYRADLPFDILRSDQARAGCAEVTRARSEIGEVGDGRMLAAGRTVDADGEIVLAPFRVAAEGWSARKWLDASSLANLATLGVAEVRWTLPARRFIEGKRLADKANGIGRARLVVTADPFPARMLLLRRAPTPASPSSLSGILSSLSSATATRDLGANGASSVLDRLWGVVDSLAAEPVLAPDRAASFLLFAESSDGELELDSALRAVWLDGFEIGAAAP